MGRRPRGRPQLARSTIGDIPQVTTPRAVEVLPATAPPVANGPTTGYRDGPAGVVHRADFPSGVLADGWHDTPAKCDNCDGMSHPDFVDVEV